MNEDARRLAAVQAAIKTLVADGASQFRPGDVATHQRNLGDPIPVWELRAIFTELGNREFITLDEATGSWSLSANSNSVAAG